MKKTQVTFGKKLGLFFVTAVLVFTGFQQSVAALTESGLESIILGYPHYDPTESGTCVSGANATPGGFLPTGPGSTLEGHTLPALVGGTGIEERAVRNGNSASLAPGTSNPGASLALSPNGLTDADVQYYFNMRWRYAVWDWRGDDNAGPESVDWYTEKVRKVLVTNAKNPDNPADDVSVVVSIVESGPAPWTGVQQPDEIVEPDYWRGFLDGTPPQYEGRVSGLAPDAFNALGTDDELRRRPGGGADLYYQWAPDQNVQAGTKYTGEISGAIPPKQLAQGQSQSVECNAGGAVGDFVFYSQYDPQWRYECYGPENSNGGCQLSNIGEAGCGPSSVAMVVSTMTTQRVTPPEVAQYSYDHGWYKGAGTSWGLFSEGIKNWGLKTTAIGTDLNRAATALRNGALVIASGTGTAPYTGGGHIIVLRGVTSDGRILIGDSNTDGASPSTDENNTREWEQSQIAQGLRGLWIITK